VIRTLIVDDEPLARETVRLRLERERDIEIVGEAGDGPAAVAAIRRHVPDLVILDVQMPGLDGFQVLERVASDCLPAVVFVTAYDKFALRAFDVHAVDYLLKPFTAERLQRALDHVREDLERDTPDASRERIAGLLDERARLASGSSAPTDVFLHRLTVRDGDRFVLVKTEEIDWIEAAANYLRIHARGKGFLLRSTMTALGEKLDPRQFARIHRSTIVNIDRIREIRPEWHGDYDVVLNDGKVLRLSRSYRSALLSK
jgi:two-component system, LytTR family, response regulator